MKAYTGVEVQTRHYIQVGWLNSRITLKEEPPHPIRRKLSEIHSRSEYSGEEKILVNNQLDALFSMYLLFQLSTCFKHLVLIIRRVKLYQYSIWYTSHYVGDCLVCRSGIPGSHLHRVIYTSK